MTTATPHPRRDVTGLLQALTLCLPLSAGIAYFGHYYDLSRIFFNLYYCHLLALLVVLPLLRVMRVAWYAWRWWGATLIANGVALSLLLNSF